MSSAYRKSNCYFCGKLLNEPEIIEIDDNGNIIACCKDCFEAAILFVKGRKNERKITRCDEKSK